MTTMTRFSEFFESKLNKLITSPTGPARRAMLFLCMFLICADNVWGKETIIWSGDAATEVSPLPSDKTELLKVGSTFRVYVSPFTQLYVARDYKSGSEPWVGVFSSSGNIDTNSEYAKESSYYEFVLKEDNIVLLKDDKLKISANGGGKISKITVETIDAFLNTPRSTCLPFSKPTEVAAGTETVVIEKPDDWPSIEAKYVRWYVANGEDVYDITGDDVSKPHLTLTTDLSFVTDEAHGSYWHSSSSEGASTLPFPTLKIPSGASIDEYQVIAVLSTEEGTTSGDDLTKEPAYDVVYTFTFEYPFKGDASSLTPITKEYTVTESKKTDVLTLAFDFSNSKIKLLDSSDNELGSQDMGGLWSSISSGGTLNSGQPFYVRWFLEKDGVETYIANAIQDAGTSYQTPAKERYGLYWQSNGGESLTDIMKIKLDGSKLPSDLTDYNLVCTIATDLTGEDTNAESKLSHEPSTMAMKYSISFKDAPWEGTITSDAFIHSKELLVKSDATEAKLTLSSSIAKVLSEYGVTTIENLFKNLHFRWYVMKKNSEGTFEKVPNSEDYFTHDNFGQIVKSGEGIYWNTKTVTADWQKPTYDAAVSQCMDFTFNKPASDSWRDYRVVAVLSNDLTTQTVVGGLLETEPTKLNMVYYFNFFVEGEFEFVHYKGASGRDFISHEDDSRIGVTTIQKGWYNSESAALTASELVEKGELKSGVTDFRQGVHTVEYDIYVDETSEEGVPLELPLFNYMQATSSIEPAAYFRWYDWETDKNDTDRLKGVGNQLIKIDGSAKNNAIVERGWFMMNNSDKTKQFTHNGTYGVGVEFYPKDLTGVRVIACDVSKYYDGIYTDSNNQPYLMHEPTISVRYIFNVRPASKCAADIETGHSTFTKAENDIAGGTSSFSDNKNTMFSDMFEDNGRVVVSYNTQESLFVLRADLPADNKDKGISNYYIKDGSTVLKATSLEWYAYLEDESGIWKGSRVLPAASPGPDYDSETTKRISSFRLTSLYDTYQLVGGTDTKEFNASNPISSGTKFHLVGYVKSGSVSKAFSHYELQFLNAYPLSVTELQNESNKARTDEILEQQMQLQAVVDFNDKIQYDGDNDMRKPTNESMNYATMPMAWEEAHYGYCYTTIDDYRLPSGEDAYGLTPLHGDYILLKSMNVPGVSEGRKPDRVYNYNNAHKSSGGWWSDEQLYDYTAEMYGGAKGWGTFYYTDASDESRTIATLHFDANLCAGSELCFTMMISDMTEIPRNSPQVLASVYALNSDGTKGDHIISFLSCELNSVCADSHGIWYQIYGRGIVPENLSLTGKYVVEVDNYSRNTNGADYCVDELRFYTSTGKLLTEQQGGGCEDAALKLTTSIPVSQLESKMPSLASATSAPVKLYYRIFQKTGEEMVGDKKKVLYKAYPKAVDYYGNGGKDYGEVDVYKYVLDEDGKLESSETTRNAGYYFDADGNLRFKLFENKEFKLDGGYEYIFVLTKSLEDANLSKWAELSNWADPNQPCDVFSNFFVPRRAFVSLVDASGDPVSTTFAGSCSGSASAVINFKVKMTVPVTPTKEIPSGFVELDEIVYDYFVGSKDDLASGGTYAGLVAAVRKYRTHEADNSITYTTTLPSDKYSSMTDDEWTVVQNAYSAGKLLLQASQSLNHTITASTSILAMPVKQTWTVDSKNYDVCDYLVLDFKVNGGGSKPELTLGFEDVTYPGDYTRVVRIGLEQIANAKVSGTHTLHIPVQSFKDNAGGTTGSIVFDGADLTLRAVYGDTGSKTTDPTKTTANAVIATLQDDASAGRPTVNASHKYLAVKFDDNFTFNEGFQYELHTVYYDETDDDGNAPATGACTDDLYLIIKVVPKYVTWRKENQTNRNWNNDDNWTRSVKDTLYSTTYKDNSATLGQPNTYTPMKFTYVTIPTGYGTQKTLAANLANLNQTSNITTSDDAKGIGVYSSTQAGDGSSIATANIEYDMLVRWGTYTTALDGTDVDGDKCLGHGSISKGTSNIYDCEKFRGNVCREIYFKPQAELVNQQYLRYEKAWVEKELEPNRWYLMSAPLKDTYAGDMYVPYADGRQTTEAFQSISFGDGTGAYSRTKYPVYQRSWGKSAKVYVNKNDVRSDYAAQLGYTTVSAELAEWGHTYNDVTVPYSTLQGFSIRAHRKTQAKNTLIRLPKADTSYDYYNADFDDTNERVEPKDATKTVSKSDLGRLVTDGTSDGTIDVTVADLQAQGTDDDMTYYLVGNPYMCSIDMGKFFDVNSSLDKHYLTYEASTASTVDATATPGKIRPLQAFFVKSASTTPTIKFTKDMMIDGNFADGSTATSDPSNDPTGSARAAEAPALTLTATNGSTASKARVALSDQASAGYVASEDVETLFDSNLSDVPVVFTTAAMADAHQQRAVSIDVRPSIDVVPFGVACADSDEPVEVTIDYGQWTADGSLVYVIDAVTGESTEMGEGRAVTVQPNDYGRYFLSTRGDLTAIERTEVVNGIVVSVRGHQVSVRAAEPLQSVRVLNAGGSLMSSVAPGGHEATISIDNGGVFVVEARTNSEIKAVKVMVRK